MPIYGLMTGNEAITGLDWNGNPSGRRAIVFTSPPSQYPMTYIWRIYQRNQIAIPPAVKRYYTTFFWGNNGQFDWGEGYGGSYYGAHPYPEGVGNPGTRDGTGDGKWEIAADANDFTALDNGTAPYPTYNQWYTQAFVVQDVGGGTLRMRFYVNLPSTATNARITYDTTTASRAAPPSPCIIWGQAPDYLGSSWGGYDRWEEQNAIIRRVSIYNYAMSEANILEVAEMDTNAAVLAKCSQLGITNPYYLNANWTVTDISDKSGNGNNPAWAGTERPTLYEG